MAEELDDFLAHYGVLGMKWGVRKDSGGVKVARKTRSKKGRAEAKPATVSADASRAKSAQGKAKTKGLDSLSNAELKSLNERMNLEQSYNRMNPKSVSRGKQVADGLLGGVRGAIGLARTGQDIYNIVKSPMVKDLTNEIKKRR